MRNPIFPLFGLLLCATVTSQKPPAWTIDEATVAAVLPALARGDAVPFTRKAMHGAQLCGYQWRRLDAP